MSMHLAPPPDLIGRSYSFLVVVQCTLVKTELIFNRSRSALQVSKSQFHSGIMLIWKIQVLIGSSKFWSLRYWIPQILMPDIQEISSSGNYIFKLPLSWFWKPSKDKNCPLHDSNWTEQMLNLRKVAHLMADRRMCTLFNLSAVSIEKSKTIFVTRIWAILRWLLEKYGSICLRANVQTLS